MRKPFYIGLSWMSSSDKKRHIEGRRIVTLLDAQTRPQEALGDEAFAAEPGGRPYFADHHADFSISHSRNIAAAALLLPAGETPCKVGCDIQYGNPNKSCVEISRRFFHADEQAYVEATPETQVRNFYRIWVLKEAWLKLHGLSVFDMAQTPAFSIGSAPKASQVDSDFVFFLYELTSPDGELYALALIRQRDGSLDEESEPEVRWFSDTVLTLNRVEDIYAAQSPENTVTPKI